MPLSIKEITSIQDLLIKLKEDNAGYPGSIWYRGQANADWSLIPGYYRLRDPLPESTLLTRFRQNAAMLINKTPDRSFDWLFLMQHYGVPTRLLDWSESPLVALYFAVEGNLPSGVSAALWSLRPSELNRIAGIRNKDEEFFIPSFEDIDLENHSIENLKSKRSLELLPLAVIATRNNPRIQAQHGVFTIHHHERVAIEEVGDSSHVIKYIIPEDAKAVIIEQLALLGYTKFQLFPELSSIGDIIKRGLV